MNIAIVDDQMKDRENLQWFVKKYCKHKNITVQIAHFSDGEEFIAKFEPNQFTIVFLDVFLKTWDGIEVAKKIREQDDWCKIVFVSVSGDRALDGYDVNATHYLVKPLCAEKMNVVMDQCTSRWQRENRFIEVVANRIPTHIFMKDILYADVYVNAVQVHTRRGVAKVYTSFRDFAPLLLCDERFLQCYHGCIVNMDHIFCVEGSSFVLDDGQKISMRLKGASMMKKAYNNHVFLRMREEGEL